MDFLRWILATLFIIISVMIYNGVEKKIHTQDDWREDCRKCCWDVVYDKEDLWDKQAIESCFSRCVGW